MFSGVKEREQWLGMGSEAALNRSSVKVSIQKRQKFPRKTTLTEYCL